jgi:hypothetical protein
MSCRKYPRSDYSNLQRYDLVKSRTSDCQVQKTGVDVVEENYRENLGSFSIYASVRPPYNYEGGSLAGVT